ncbi:DUF3987 domain-containing protein, partial [Parabacteroides sp.]
NPFTDGGRHSYLIRLVSALNSAGFSESEVTAECLYRYTVPGFGEKEILGTVADIYRRYRSAFGTSKRVLPDGMKSKLVYESLQSLSGIPENAGEGERSPLGFDIEPEDADLPTFSDELLGTLPGLLRDILRTATGKRERDLKLLASLTALSTVMPGVDGMFRRNIFEPSFYTLVIGPSGSGKGCIDMVRYLVDPWQLYVKDNSKAKNKEYKAKQEAYDLYKARQKASGGKAPQAGPTPEEPEPVPIQQLHVSGYTSTARMIEQLEENKPYASFFYETELESASTTLAQDFGNYSYVLNQAFQHERISCSSKMNGSAFVDHPVLGFLASGTPGMLQRFIPSTESGLFSRMMIYRLTGCADYQPLTSADDTDCILKYYRSLGQRVLNMAIHLEKHPTFVRFTDAQRKRLNRYFEKEYNNVRAFGNEDVASVVLRDPLIVFRLCMVLTGIRKGESRSQEREMVVSDDDFNLVFDICRVCLKHSLFVATSLKPAAKVHPHKLPTAQLDLFAAMPDEFSTESVLSEGSVRGICRAAVFAMLKKTKEFGLLDSVSRGKYKKTDKGRDVLDFEIPR